MRKYLQIFIFISFFIALILSSACSTFNRTDDAVRIKPDSAKKYNFYPFNPSLVRNGNTLRGTVIKLESTIIPDTCPPTPNTKLKSKTNVLFLDWRAPNLDFVEYIPIEDVDFIGSKFNQPINVFESFNYPLEPKRFRRVPWDTIFVECEECGCTPFTLKWAWQPPKLDLRCPSRECNWYFIELRGGYTSYADYVAPDKKISTDAFFGELAFGLRFGNRKQYGAGILLSTGVPIYNSFTSTTKQRPLGLFHFRWDLWRSCQIAIDDVKMFYQLEYNPRNRYAKVNFETETSNFIDSQKRECFSPFFFFDIGMPFDKFSLDLVKLNLNTKCKDKIKASVPYLNTDALPISFTLGAGIDFHLSSYLDFSIDAGYRNFAFGESQTILGYANVPSYRRINMFFFRTGLTF
ncbi:MAG: hypothetical protein ACUVQ1_02365 [Candidatus Kapaibacteriales bacterium]